MGLAYDFAAKYEISSSLYVVKLDLEMMFAMFEFFVQSGYPSIGFELNNNTAHRTHNNTVSWFIPLQSDSQTLTKLDEKTSKENPRTQYFYDSSSSSLLSTHVLITLFGSPSPNLVVLLNVTKL